jgi:REP element-mobilizing transposase RayT
MCEPDTFAEETTPRRKNPRLPGFGYGKGHSYFITLCTHNREHLFGRITVDTVSMLPAGGMIAHTWELMAEYNPGLVLDAFVVMPNHFHAILGLVDLPKGPGQCPAPTPDVKRRLTSKPVITLPYVVRKFKTISLRNYAAGVREGRWERYEGRLWQRGYFEHVIRDVQDLAVHRDYISSNPRKWQLDKYLT